MTNTRDKDTNLDELREKIEGHILSIREDIRSAGFNTSYIKIYLCEEDYDGEGKKEFHARLHNGAQVKREDRIDFFYNIKEVTQ